MHYISEVFFEAKKSVKSTMPLGFCEYRDPKLVEAAVDLLHGFEHRGMNLYVLRAYQDKHSNSWFSMSSNQFANSNNSNNSKKSTSKNKNKNNHQNVKQLMKLHVLFNHFQHQ